jgi:hypothetical protein
MRSVPAARAHVPRASMWRAWTSLNEKGRPQDSACAMSSAQAVWNVVAVLGSKDAERSRNDRVSPDVRNATLRGSVRPAATKPPIY